jgi:UDP-N-acetylglucosamine--N-acetylmuramyl-(pentapeptide) pyrophosphoryl-undecaprenol N-acetylglucosamine transferase
VRLFSSSRPDVILSFGGYIGVPVILAGVLYRIPVVLHEQTLRPGRANVYLSWIAAWILLSWEDSRAYFPRAAASRSVVVGNPIRSELVSLVRIRKKPRKNKYPTIYITGGSTGAHALNIVIEESLESLLASYTIVHQCGDSSYRDYERLCRRRDSLPSALRRRYSIHKTLSSSTVRDVLEQTAILIGRSGANTVSEVALLGIPALLIPLPWQI